MLEVKELSVKYLNQKDWLLEKTDLLVANPSCIGIIGKNGEGKTTFALTLIGLIPYLTKGNVEGHFQLNSIDYTNKPIEERLLNISYVFQDSESQVLFGNVSNILGLYESNSDSKSIREFIEFFKIGHLLNREPNSLSSGELQRVVLVASLRNNPDLLIYDEVTSVLDPILKHEFSKFIYKLVLMSKHVILMGQRPEILSPYTKTIFFIKDKRLSTADNLVLEKDSNALSIDSFYRNPQKKFNLFIKHFELFHKNENRFHFQVKDLEILHGQNIAILGVNGSGKTTFLNILYGLIRPKYFDIYINEEIFKSFKRSPLNGIVDCVFHSPYNQIIGGTIEEEINLINIEDEISRLFPFMVYNSDPLNLSFGQMRMLCFLSVFLRNKSLFCFDEPEFGLDSLNFTFVQDYLLKNKLEKQRTILFSTHDLEFAKKCADRIIVFKNGKICADEMSINIESISDWFKSYNL